MADYQQLLANIQNQLNSVSSLMAPNNTVSPPMMGSPSLPNTLQPDMFAMVKTAVHSELSRLGFGNTITPNNVVAGGVATQQQPNQQIQQLLGALNQNPLSQFLPIIGSAFTKEQQEWISQPQILMGIPGFLMSSDGKTILNMMLESYKEFVNKGNAENK